MAMDGTADVVHIERDLLEEYQRIVDKDIFHQSAIAEGFCLHFNGDEGVQAWFRTGEKKTPISAIGHTVEEALCKLIKRHRPLEITSELKDQIFKRFQDICRHDGKRHSTDHGYSYYCDICGKHLPSL